MKVKNVVAHIIDKEQASKNNTNPKATIIFSERLFDVNNEIVKGFSEKLAMTYFDKKSRFYTNFKKTESSPIFEVKMNNYLNSDFDFFKYSKVITDDLREEMDSARMSSGGYLIIMEYESSNNYKYLFVALLNNKIEYSINTDLELSQFLSLNIDKMAMASVINISKYLKKEDNYITFLKGIREIPDYYIKFMGADKDIKRDLREQTRNWIEAIGKYLKNDETKTKDIQLIIQELIQKVKQLKKDEKFMTADTIANIIEPADPEKFISYIYDEENDFQVNPEIETMDTRILSSYGIIRYENKQKDFLLKFSKKSIGDIISFDDKNNIVTINDTDIVKGIKTEIDIQKILTNESYNFSLKDEILGSKLEISNIQDTSEFISYEIDGIDILENKVLIPEVFFNDENIIFIDNYEKLIENYPSYYKLELEKKQVFFLESKIFLENDTSNFIKAYKILKNLDLLLNKISIDKKDTKNHTITYEIVQKKKILISNLLDYSTINDLDKKILSQIKFIHKRFNSNSELDTEIRITFLKKAIEDTFSEENITFINVLNKFERLIQQYEIIFRSYIEELDTEKVKYDYEKRIQEINEKLSSLIGDIHTKQIILPIAFVIGIAQVKQETPTPLIFMIFLGLLIFTTLLTMYSSTQNKLISSIKNNIDYWQNFYKSNLKTLYNNEIKIKIIQLNNIIEKVKSNMFYTILFSWGLILVLFIYLVFKFL